MKVKDPHGQTWRVTRRWMPWRRRITSIGPFAEWDVAPFWDDPNGWIIAIVGFLLAPVILLAVFVAAEFFLLLLLLPLAVLARAALGRHWVVEARRGFTIVWDAPAGDWQASGLRIHEVADAIRRGAAPARSTNGSPGVHPDSPS